MTEKHHENNEPHSLHHIIVPFLHFLFPRYLCSLVRRFPCFCSGEWCLCLWRHTNVANHGFRIEVECIVNGFLSIPCLVGWMRCRAHCTNELASERASKWTSAVECNSIFLTVTITIIFVLIITRAVRIVAGLCGCVCGVRAVLHLCVRLMCLCVFQSSVVLFLVCIRLFLLLFHSRIFVGDFFFCHLQDFFLRCCLVGFRCLVFFSLPLSIFRCFSWTPNSLSTKCVRINSPQNFTSL